MATNNRNRGRGANGSRPSRNRNPEGRNQHSGIKGTARDNPLATAAAVGGAVAAGLFLWSRRNQISDQVSDLAEQITDWRKGTQSNPDFASGDAAQSSSGARDGQRAQVEIAEEALTLKETGTAA